MHVVVIVERFEQFHDAAGGRHIDLDLQLRDPGHFAEFRFQLGVVEGIGQLLVIFRRGGDLDFPLFVLFDIIPALLEGDFGDPFFIAAGREDEQPLAVEQVGNAARGS